MISTIPTNPIVEMLVGSSWVDITPDCRLNSADSGGGIEITRGVPNEGAQAEPTQLNFTLNNGPSKVPAVLGQTGCYSPNNPAGPYWGKLGRNQRVRLGMDRQVEGFDHVETSSWGSLPDRTVNNDVIKGEKWHLTGTASFFSISGSTGIIGASAGGTRFASFGTFGDCNIKVRVKCSSRDTEFGILPRVQRVTMVPPAGIDPTFETGIQGWFTSSGTLLQDTSIQHSGTASIKMTVTGAPTTASLAVSPTNATSYGAGKIVPGGSYNLRYWVRCSIAATVQQVISWYDEDGVTFKSATTTNTALAANTWTMCEGNYTAPQDAGWLRPGAILIGSPAAGTQMWLDDVEVLDNTDYRWYSANYIPGTTDQIKFGKVAPGLARSQATNLGQQLVVNTYYWMEVQTTGQRLRMRMWKDGDAQPGWVWRYFDDVTVSEGAVPQTGEIGVFANAGTGVVTFDSFQVDTYRAHAEIAELPPRWDLSRSDRWVPIQARGILRRLGQGRKALKSAVSLHLNSYTASSKGWWSLEEDLGDTAGNNIQGGAPGRISGLTFGAPDLTGVGLLPGVSGYAQLAADNASFVASNLSHTPGASETYLWFTRLPSLPASEVTIASVLGTGTVRTWYLNVQVGGALRLIGKDRSGTNVIDQNVAAWGGNPDLPVGCWLACTLLITQSGGNINFALNHHRPGSSSFFTTSGSIAGTIGAFTGISFKGSPALTAAGNLAITQVMHYAGDLPFVTNDFERAAIAYLNELTTSRFIRLCTNAGIPWTTMGFSGTATAMGYQLPAKLLDLLADCADVEGGIVGESRDEFELVITTRDSMWNRYVHNMDIDAGHLSEPLEPNSDDQQTRNDVTISRPNGGFARSIQTSGIMNTNPPETDVNGVGTYDVQDEVNVAVDTQCQSVADWRRSRGTVADPRYPVMHADLSATAYRTDPALAAAALQIDAGDVIWLTNPEADYASREQTVFSYTEQIDQFDWDLTFTALPGTLWRVGALNYTARLGTESHTTNAGFVSGTGTRLTSARGAGRLWVNVVDSEASFPFDIEASGVRLRVEMVGDVLNFNPGFEIGATTGWTPSSANLTLFRDRALPKRGTYCMRCTAAAAGTDGPVQAAANSSDVSPAIDYLISGWVKTEVAATAMRLAVDWYQTNNTTLISTSSPATVTTLAGTWTWFTAVVTSPALAEWARLKVTNVFAGATRMWVDDLRIMPVSSYSVSPQTLTVRQLPTNGIIKTIPSGEAIKLVDFWRLGW